MKMHWPDIKSNVQIWLAFFFLRSLPVLISCFRHIEFSFGVGSEALDHIGGQPWWYPYIFWLAGHWPDCAVFATYAWAIYKVISLLRKKHKGY